MRRNVLGVWDKIKAVWSVAAARFGGVWQRVKEGTVKVWQAIKDVVLGVLGGIKNAALATLVRIALPLALPLVGGVWAQKSKGRALDELLEIRSELAGWWWETVG